MNKHELIAHKPYDAPATWLVNHKEMPNETAQMAIAFVERWGLVAGLPDGEDSAGRQKLRLPTPDELVTRASDIAAALWAEFGKREWLLAIPSTEEAEKVAAERSAKDRKNDR